MSNLDEPEVRVVTRMSRHQIENLTSHEDVNRLLADLADGLVGILVGDLVGLYLTGSLTYGDFSTGSSDIDFLAVLDRPVDDEQRASLDALHVRLAAAYPRWAERVEGSYITRDMLSDVAPPVEPRPYVNGGAFWDPDPRYGNEWLVNLYALRASGLALVGPDPADAFPPVDIKDVREASRRDLVEEWLPKLNQPEFFDNSHLQAYVALTLCRILHRARHDDVVSKRVAAGWVRENVDEQWVADLVDQALRWRHGESLDAAGQVQRFIGFTADRLGHSSD